jgi:ubiquinone/menaquinone biosynthesis C-methylase UbiE
MNNPLRFVPLIINQFISPQKLGRLEEPTAITSESANILDYDRVLSSALTLNYALALEIIFRARSMPLNEPQGSAIDLACGPAHYSLFLATFLKYADILGLDLSPGMIEVARKNADLQKLKSRAQFQVGDITHLESIPSNTFELSSFADAAHHMSTLKVVTKIFEEMDRITRPSGLIVVSDLVRLRTQSLTDQYVNLLGHDYQQRGIPQFLKDFRNSMFAAWTTNELHSAIPRSSKRVWIQFYPRGLPTVQFIIGLPVGRQKLFLRTGVPWSSVEGIIPREYRLLWKLSRLSLFLGTSKKVMPR